MQVRPTPGQGAPGEVLPSDAGLLRVACGEGALDRAVQRPGGRRQPVREWLAGCQTSALASGWLKRGASPGLLRVARATDDKRGSPRPLLPPRHERLPRLSVIALLAALPLLASRDLLGIESGEAVAARNEAEGKAIGSACRHAMRAIEDCYTSIRRRSRPPSTGWREMDEYMRENKLEGIAPVVRPVEPSKKKKPKPAEDEEIIDEPKAKADDKAHGKSTH